MLMTIHSTRIIHKKHNFMTDQKQMEKTKQTTFGVNALAMASFFLPILFSIYTHEIRYLAFLVMYFIGFYVGSMKTTEIIARTQVHEMFKDKIASMNEDNHSA